MRAIRPGPQNRGPFPGALPPSTGGNFFQPNQAEHWSRTHELDLLQSQQVSGLLRSMAVAAVVVGAAHLVGIVDPQPVYAQDSFLRKATTPLPVGINPKVLRGDAVAVDIAQANLLRASTPTAAAATNQGRLLSTDPTRPDEPDAFSWSQYIMFFDAPILRADSYDPAAQTFDLPSNLLRASTPSAGTVQQNLRPLVATAEQIAAYDPTVTRPRFEPVLQKVRFASTDPDTPAAYDSRLFRPHFEPVLQRVRFQSTEPGAVATFDPTLARPRFEQPLQHVRFWTADAILQPVADSTFARPRFEAASVQQRLRVLLTEPERPQEWPPTLARPRFEPPPQGINPRVLVGMPEPWGSFSGYGSFATRPRFEPFVPAGNMPNLLGRELYIQATAELIAAGITPNIGLVSHTLTPNLRYFQDPWPVTIVWLNTRGAFAPGIVVAQSPAAGTQVAFGTTITLTVSSFPMGISTLFTGGSFGGN